MKTRLCILGAWLTIASTLSVAAPPNVLFMAVDDLRPELQCTGETHMITPHIDQLADEGRLFRHHYVSVPTCGASRFAMMTGRRPAPGTSSVANSAFNALPASEGADPETWAHLLRRHGWHTVSLGKVSHEPDGFQWNSSAALGGDDRGRTRVSRAELRFSWDEILFGHDRWGSSVNPIFTYAAGHGRTQGVSPTYEIGVDALGQSLPDEAYQDGLIARAAIARLEAFEEEGTRFCMAVGFYRPHLPFNAPKAYYDLYTPSTLPDQDPLGVPAGAASGTVDQSGEINNYGHGYYPGDPGTHTDPEYRKRLRHAYFASVSYVDAQVGKVLDALDQLGLAENTVVVLWGDHGWMLDDYDRLGKHTLLERCMASPLIMRLPTAHPGYATFPGVHAEGLVESVDIYPTLAELCGVTPPATAIGTSLLPLVVNPYAPGKGHVYGAWSSTEETVRTDRWRLIKSGSATYDLYDLEAHPYELTDVSASEPGVVSDLVSALPVQGTRPPTTTYALWAEGYFTPAELADPTVSGETADPDADRALNFYEYWGASHPRSGLSRPLMYGAIEDLGALGFPGSYFTCRIDGSTLTDDVVFRCESTTNLVGASWSPLDVHYLDSSDLGAGMRKYRYRSALPLPDDEADTRSMRMRLDPL